MSSIIILQARTSSSRLPGKVLLPVCGVPLAVLAAQRAANTGRRVIVATSTEGSDDVLVDTLERFDIPCYRGSLKRVLDRVLAATSNFSESSVFIRLTADNVFPDGNLIDEMVAEFLSQELNYLCCNGLESGLPYGMSVEVTRLGHLREAARCTEDPADQEHVTPYVIRQYGVTNFKRYQHLNKGHYRCTVDNFDDYLNIGRVFKSVNDPVAVSSFDLIDRLDDGIFQPTVSSPVLDMVLGAAQLGMDYGIANHQGAPDQAQAASILKTAIANGVGFIDTARAYGNSEAVIGRSLSGGWSGRARIITKLSPLTHCSSEPAEEELKAQVDTSILKSCMSLGVSSLDILMLHRANHLTMWDGLVWQHLLQIQEEGMIGDLGVSVQTPEELMDALQKPSVMYLQLPFNILDTRWEDAIVEIIQVKERRALTVHVRSSLLQGLLVSRERKHWQRAGVNHPEELWKWLDETIVRSGCNNVVDLCIRYVRSLPWVDGVVVGMESLEQFQSNIESFDQALLDAKVISEIDASRPDLDSKTLDPAQWSKE
ncbi:aldo/keto reductase [Halomonas salinarum]|uniref:aldo/keto reductase n=1 Tax=Halomonas salinarum TaxID=1158993 RepID=UPI00143AEDE4|nr:aldo/keto reductase [Halomonas salinarum]